MAAFSSYQHHHPFLPDSSSGLLPMEEGNLFSQFYPPNFPTHDQEIIINNPLDGGVFESSCVDHHSDNKPSNNSVTKNQSTVSSTEQVTLSTVTHHMDKKRKNRTNASSLNSARSKDPREVVKSKKQKKSNDALVRIEENKNNSEADEKKVSQEPPKDYIHVRARRGQATDSHSLAERVRREKISERMKILQKLVPGCDKVTGKALMLDEIINYVQSLQNQVELLSMKLSSVNPMFYDFGMDLDDTFMVSPDQRLNKIAAASAPLQYVTVPQCSLTQLTAFTDTTTAAIAAAFAPADHNNYPILDTVTEASLLLQQGQRPNSLISQDNGRSLLWDLAGQKQDSLNPYVCTNNLCSFH